MRVSDIVEAGLCVCVCVCVVLISTQRFAPHLLRQLFTIEEKKKVSLLSHTTLFNVNENTTKKKKKEKQKKKMNMFFKERRKSTFLSLSLLNP